MPNHGLEPGGFGNDLPEETPPQSVDPRGATRRPRGRRGMVAQVGTCDLHG